MIIDKKELKSIIKEEIEKLLNEESSRQVIQAQSLKDIPLSFDPTIPTDTVLQFNFPLKKQPEQDFEDKKSQFNNWWRSIPIDTRWLLEKWLSKHLKPNFDYKLVLDAVSKTMAASKGNDPTSPRDPNEKPR